MRKEIENQKRVRNKNKRVAVILLVFFITLAVAAIVILFVDYVKAIEAERDKLSSTYEWIGYAEPRICTKLGDNVQKCEDEYEGLMLDEAETLAVMDGIGHAVVMMNGEAREGELQDTDYVRFYVVDGVVVKASFAFRDGLEKLYMLEDRSMGI